MSRLEDCIFGTETLTCDPHAARICSPELIRARRDRRPTRARKGRIEVGENDGKIDSSGTDRNMSLKNLSRRLEQLEDRLRPNAGEAHVLTLVFVNSDRHVVEERHITLPIITNQRRRRWRQRFT
jgi:hypothetical protein